MLKSRQKHLNFWKKHINKFKIYLIKKNYSKIIKIINYSKNIKIINDIKNTLMKRYIKSRTQIYYNFNIITSNNIAFRIFTF